LKKKQPNNVEEIRLDSCKVSNEVAKLMLKTIGAESQVERLILNDIDWNSESLKMLAHCIKKAKYLRTIDLSYNRLTLYNILPVLESICHNSKLINVNLSWNKLVEGTNFGA
jgi:Ran GTPase-activating protein (RanGAP) involved in mRNA processing and transport